MTNFICQLPAELLIKVSEYLTDDGKSLLSLSFANKQLYSTIYPELFKNINVEIGDMSFFEFSSGFQQLQSPYGDSATMMKAVDCEFTQYFRQAEIYIVNYYNDYDEVLKYIFSIKTLKHIQLFVTDVDSRNVLGFLSIVPPSTQVDVNLDLTFGNMEAVSWLEGLVAQPPENINFIVSGDYKLSDHKRNPIPSLLARMEYMTLCLMGDHGVSELNEFLSHGRDALRELHLFGESASIVADQPRLIIPDQVNSLHVQCSVSGPNQLTITGKSLKRLECNALPPTVRIDAQIVDLKLNLMEEEEEEEEDTPSIVAENYGIYSGTDIITIEAQIASKLRIKELIRAAPSELMIFYFGGDFRGMMRTLISEATESQLTELTLCTPLIGPDNSTIVSLAEFTAKMPRLTKLTAPYSDALSDFAEPIETPEGRENCIIDLDSLKAVRASLNTI